eukprot:gb/GECH01013224.1/.p1 GENE.gb/GECH01013224.1/~~gb/GECH01013224.1/.p1  ORF type:complete len:524 (+),score=164.29 gb/GECH01013224.1/:1-1572(+)
MSFQLPELDHNSSSWGPTQTPEPFDGIPFVPFNKTDRLGKVSDWTTTNRQKREHTPSGANSTFIYVHEQDDSFQGPKTSSQGKPGQGSKKQVAVRRRQNLSAPRRGGHTMKKLLKPPTTRRHKWWRAARRHNRTQRYGRSRRPAVDIDPSWQVVAELGSKEKIGTTTPPELNEIQMVGDIHLYEKQVDRTNVKKPVQLKEVHDYIPPPSTSDDPYLMDIIPENEPCVVGTSDLIATLMTVQRSLNSWAIVAKKENGQIFFDRVPNDNSTSRLTVDETSNNPPQEGTDSSDSVESLAEEASNINAAFRRQALGKTAEEGKPADFPTDKKAFRYLEAELNGTKVYLRSPVDAIMEFKKQYRTMSIMAALQYDPMNAEENWSNRLDTQSSACIGTEIKNNSVKYAKWAVESLFSGTELLKLAFVSRKHNKTPNRHNLLKTEQLYPETFLKQINIRSESLWAVLQHFINLIQAQPDGQYLIQKDPNKPTTFIYDIPEDAFTSNRYRGDSDESENEDNYDDYDDEDLY